MPRRQTIVAGALLLTALLAVTGYLLTERYLVGSAAGLALDDSWIHLTFARSLAAGEGLAFQSGELVTGSTAPLWTALVSLLFLLPGEAVLWVKLLGTLFYLAAVLATFRLARLLDLSVPLAALAALLTALTSWMVWSALSGMEVTLFVWLTLEGMILHQRELDDAARPPLSFGVLGAACLARPEGALLVGLAVLEKAWAARGPEAASGGWRRAASDLARGLALTLAVVLPAAAFYAVVGGTVAPTTLAAKAPGIGLRLPNPELLYTAVAILFKPQPYMTLLAAAGVLALVTGRERRRGLLPGLWLLALPLAYALLSPAGRPVVVGNFGRYLFPLFPPLVLMGVLGLEPLAGALRRLPAGSARRWLSLGAAVLLLWPTVSHLGRGALQYARNVANVEDSDVAMARWLAERLDPNAVLAVNDVGAMGYLLENRLLDLAGIVHPEVRHEIDRAMAEGVPWDRGVARFVERERPDYLVVFPNWFPGLLADESRFRPVHRLAIPDNITMGGNELVVYATPWTRHPLR